jgi:hypothetical protein
MAKTIYDHAFGFGIARRRFQPREPVKKVLNQLAFLRGHRTLP